MDPRTKICASDRSVFVLAENGLLAMFDLRADKWSVMQVGASANAVAAFL